MSAVCRGLSKHSEGASDQGHLISKSRPVNQVKKREQSLVGREVRGIATFLPGERSAKASVPPGWILGNGRQVPAYAATKDCQTVQGARAKNKRTPPLLFLIMCRSNQGLTAVVRVGLLMFCPQTLENKQTQQQKPMQFLGFPFNSASKQPIDANCIGDRGSFYCQER